MTVKAKINSSENSKAEALVKVLTEQRRALIAAGSSKLITEQYMGLIRFLKSATNDELRRVLNAPVLAVKEVEESERSDKEISDMNRAEIQTLISDEYTSRKLLERIAIHRFRVPRGSMRSFSNRAMLVEKLSTLLRNEQTHTTIETVAREGTQHGMRPKV